MWFARRRCYSAALFFCAAACLDTKAYSQPSSSLELQYRYGYLTEATHAPNIINQFGSTLGGLSQEHTFRFGYRQTIASLFDLFSIEGAIEAGYSFGSFTSDTFTFSSPGQRFSLQYRSASLMARLGLHYAFSDLTLGLSGWAAIPIAPSLRQSLVTGRNDSVMATNGAILYSRIPTGLRLDLGDAHPLLASLPVTAGLFTEFDIDAFRQQNSFRTSISGGITLSWNLGNGSPPLIAGSSVATNPIPSPVPNFHAEVHFTERGSRIPTGNRVSLFARDTLIQQHVILPRGIFLNAVSTVHYDHSSKHPFAFDSLIRLDEHGIVQELPNILGLRLKKAPDISIILKASDYPAIAPLVRFFTQTCGVSPHQISFQQGLPNSNIVEIIASDDALFSPVVTQWIERSYEMKDVGIEHSITPDSALRDWVITIEQDGRVWPLASKNFISRNSISLQGIHPNGMSPAIVRLRGTDSLDRNVLASDTLQLSVLDSSSNRTPPALVRYVFPLFDTDRTMIDRQLSEIKSMDRDPNTTFEYFERNGVPASILSEVEHFDIPGTESFHSELDDDMPPYLVITFRK